MDEQLGAGVLGGLGGELVAADGDRVAAGDVVAEISAPTRGLLTAERTLLNLVCHLSGVATATRARARLAAKLSYSTLGFALAPREFTLSALAQHYEAALGHPVDPTNLQRILTRRGELVRCGRSAPPIGYQARGPGK